jgi:hypothetical protein
VVFKGKAFQIILLQALLCKGSQVFGKAGIHAKKDDILTNFVDTTRDCYESIVSD